MSGRVVVMALGFVSFPIFTRVFSVAEYGIMTLAFKIAAVATVFAKIGLQQSILRFYEENTTDPLQAKKFYSTLVLGALFTALAVTLAFVVTLGVIPGTLLTPSLSTLFLIASPLIAIRAMQAIGWGFLRTEGRTKTFNLLDVGIKASTIAIACLILFFIERSVSGFFAATVAVEGLFVIALLASFVFRGLVSFRHFDPKLFRMAFVFGFPLIGYEVTGVILDSGDRFLVQHYLGAEAVGYYSAAYNMATYLQESLMSPVSLAIVPLYMKVWHSEGRESTKKFLSESLDVFVAVAGALVAAACVTSRDAITILGSRKYEAAHDLLPILVVGLFVWAMHIFLNAGLLIYKRTGVMMKIIAISCIIKLSLNFILLPRMGLKGAALATLVSYLALSAMAGYYSFKLLPLDMRVSDWMRYVFAAAVAVWPVSQVDFGNAVVNFLLKSSMAIAIYAAVLLLIHKRLQNRVRHLLRVIRTHRNSSAVPLESTDLEPALSDTSAPGEIR